MADIKGLVKKLRSEYGTNDPFALCEALHIGVLYCDLPIDVKGFYLLINNNQVIFLNQELDENEARVVCGHELGHTQLHRDFNAVFMRTQTLLNCQRYENEADMFCAYLLLDGEELTDGTEVVTMEDIARRTGLPQRLVQLYYTAGA